jgi:hypothetical protein
MHACIEPLQGSAAATTALGVFCAIERSEMHACIEPLQGSAAATTALWIYCAIKRSWLEPLQGSAAVIPHRVFLIHFMLH